MKSPHKSFHRIVKRTNFNSFNKLRQTFPSADDVNKLTVFNIGGNKARLIAAIHYNTHRVYNRPFLHIKNMIEDFGGNNENHPLASLMETIRSLIETYETQYIDEIEGNPIAALNVLMLEHGLKQSDLTEIGS